MLHDLDTGQWRARIVPTFAELLVLPEQPLVVAVDIPIGLPEFTQPGGRACEREARRLLGRRASCVFSAVGRQALRAGSRAEADALSRERGGTGVGAQAWGLAEKLRVADAAMTPERQRVVHEIHPEMSFRAMNGGTPMPHPKKSAEGVRNRVEVLVGAGLPRVFVAALPTGLRVGRDDFLDACAAAWTAVRIAEGRASRLPRDVDRDTRGLDQAIWY